jgi:hypothetical protein
MRRTTFAAVTVAAVLAAAAPASAKGIVAASVCGANGCHPVEHAAVRDGIDAFAASAAPRRPEPFFTIRMRARVSSGKVVEVFSLDWLPRAGLARPYGERSWTRPGPGLAGALRRAARGLRPNPAAELGSVTDAPPGARVVEVFAPAERGDGGGPGATVIAIAIAAAGLLAIAAVAWRTRARRRRSERPPATLAAKAR